MIVEYEHIAPFAEVNSHEAENITLLCSLHHREVTSGRLSKASVFKANKSPFCLSGKNHPSYKFALEPSVVVEVGGNSGIIDHKDKFPLSIINLGNSNYLGVKLVEGVPTFHGSFRDMSGKQAFVIEDNAIVLRRSKLWDARLSGTSFKLWFGPKRILANFQIQEAKFQISTLRVASEMHAVSIQRDFVAVQYGRGGVGYYSENHGYREEFGRQSHFIADETAEGRAFIRLPDVEPTDPGDLWRSSFKKLKRPSLPQ